MVRIGLPMHRVPALQASQRLAVPVQGRASTLAFSSVVHLTWRRQGDLKAEQSKRLNVFFLKWNCSVAEPLRRRRNSIREPKKDIASTRQARALSGAAASAPQRGAGSPAYCEAVGCEAHVLAKRDK